MQPRLCRLFDLLHLKYIAQVISTQIKISQLITFEKKVLKAKWVKKIIIELCKLCMPVLDNASLTYIDETLNAFMIH